VQFEIQSFGLTGEMAFELPDDVRQFSKANDTNEKIKPPKALKHNERKA
jgi:hypothetical protein